MELEVYEQELLDEGRYEGAIMQVQEGNGKYGPFVEVFFDIKQGFYPTAIFSVGDSGKISTQSDLFKLISQFRTIGKGEKVDPAKELIGKPVSFLLKRVESKTDPSKHFLNVVKDSIRKLEIKPADTSSAGHIPFSMQERLK